MRKAIFILLAVAFLPGVAHCQEFPSPDSALQVVLDSLSGTPLDLHRAVDDALQNATSIRQAEAAYLAAGGSAKREAGMFDPELFFSYNHLDQEQPAASFFSGAQTLIATHSDYRTGLRLNLPIGTDLELGLNASKLTTNSSFAFLNPQYDAFGSLNVRQPILGGFHLSARKQLVRSKCEFDAAKARYDQQVLAVASDVERMYWDLYAALRDYAVQILARDRAQAFVRDTDIRAQAGLVGPNQVATARAFLAEQKLMLLDREEQLDQRSDRLASLIGSRPESGVARFIPTNDPTGEYPLDSVDAVVAQALADNLDLRAAKNDVAAARALSRAALWEALPSVDLLGSLGGYGLAGRPQDVIFGEDTLRSTIQDRDFGDAVQQVGARDYPNWSVGVEVTIPLGLRRGLGEKKQLDAEVMRAEQSEIAQARSLEERVRAGHREVSHGQERLRAASAGVEAAREQVRIGLIEFHNGRSTAFELVRLSEDLAVAQRRYSEAVVRTAKAAATLRELTSTGNLTTTNK
jgi:outer membrane protein TolC